MSGEWVVLFDGCPRGFATGGVSSISSYSDGAAPSGVTLKTGSLVPIVETISERLRPLRGDVEVSSMDFRLHDTDGLVTNLYTRALEDSALTFLTTVVGAGDTSIIVANGAAITSFPTDVWINRECMRVTSRAGNTLFVTRGYYGTRAEAIDVDVAAALRPELFAYPCSLRGKRARLYRVEGTVASLRWVGFVRGGPSIAGNGASYVVSAVHAWEQESASTWGTPQPAATLDGYDAAATYIEIQNGDRSLVATSTPPTYKAYPRRTLLGALQYAAERLRLSLEFLGAGGPVRVSATEAGGGISLVATFQGFSLGAAVVRIAGEEYVATSSENSGWVEHKWFIADKARGALVRAGFALGGDDRATVIKAHAGLLSGSWAPVVGSRPGVTITPVLVGELDDGALLELDPTGQTAPGPKTNDTTFTDNGSLTFRGFARVLPKDPAARVQPREFGAYRAGLPIEGAIPMRAAIRADGAHWLETIRSLVEDNSIATTGGDSRVWSWTGYDAVLAATRDELGPVTYRTHGSTPIGTLIGEEAKLRGACVTIGADGLLSIIDIKSPMLTSTPAATITLRDWIAKTKQGAGPSDDGLVTDVEIQTPLRSMRLRDAVAMGRYGAQNTLEVATQSIRRDPRIIDDPIGYALLAAGKLLGRWRDELMVHEGEVPASRYLASCTLGAEVLFESSNAPNRSGGSGFEGATAKRAIVIGRHEDAATNRLRLELLALPVVYGFAPAARVASISGPTITLASAYAGSSNDYAGSTLTGYAKTANDRGASFFEAGFLCKLVLRDTPTQTEQDFTVESFDAALGTVKATASIPTSPTNWASLVAGGAIVDVVFASYGSALTLQRIFAAVADEALRVIGGTADRARKWAP